MSSVKSAVRTLRFLEMLAHKRNGLTFAEIQTGLNIPKSSAHGLIQELLNNGYIIYNDYTNRYFVGLEFVKMCAICLEGTDLLKEFQLLASELGKDLGQTTHICALDGRYIRYLAKYETNSNLSSMSSVGLSIPAHCCATGKMLLSQYSNDELTELYQGYSFEMLTEQSINSFERLIGEVIEVRTRGYGVEYGEAKEFAACIAMPIYQNGKMIAAFSATYPIYLLQKSDHVPILETMKHHKKMIESRLLSH